MSLARVLVHYDPRLPLRLAVDGSAYGVGVVISHVYPDGAERPIAYAFRTLTASEKNYAQFEKEALALIFGVRKFHKFLYGRRFILYTNHKPLTAILGLKKTGPPLAAARLQRWALLLAAYNYQIEFKPTRAHAIADGLPQLPLLLLRTNTSLMWIFSTSGRLKPYLKAATRQDPVLSQVLRYTR